jgi:hypothetical protein
VCDKGCDVHTLTGQQAQAQGVGVCIPEGHPAAAAAAACQPTSLDCNGSWRNMPCRKLGLSAFQTKDFRLLCCIAPHTQSLKLQPPPPELLT